MMMKMMSTKMIIMMRLKNTITMLMMLMVGNCARSAERTKRTEIILDSRG